MGSSKQEQDKDTLIFLLQSLDFLINIKKSELKPTQKIQFLGVEIDSLPQDKVLKIKSQCQKY